MSERTFRKRSRLMRLLLFAGMASLVLRLTYIQIVHAHEYSKNADKWLLANNPVDGVRGAILDRNGQKLAFTGVAYDLNIDVDVFYAKDAEKNGDTPEAYAQFLAPLLGTSEMELMKYLTPKDSNGNLFKKGGFGLGPKGKSVDASINDKLNEMHKQDKFLGITATRTDIRRYPFGDFASHVLGYVGPDANNPEHTKGQAGVESVYNSVLAGKPGQEEYYTDRGGTPIASYQPVIKVPPVNGEDVVLTIDSTIQHYVEDELNNIVEKYAPKHVSAIVVDPNNGEVLALANRPSYDPGNYAQANPPEALWNDWALRAFEPGSTFKSFVLTGALAEHRLNLDDTFDSGSITVDGRTISDWNLTGWGQINYRYAVQVSSNVGFVHVGQKLGKDLENKYIDEFGFNKPTGIDLPGEEDSVLFNPKTMSDVDLATESFGQGVSVTPIQQVAAMEAIANGGKIYQPHVVKEYRDPTTGKTISEVQPKVTGVVADPQTMKTVTGVLEDAIKNDTNPGGAYIPGYHVAGKTGTAQISDNSGGYDDTYYRCSFEGFAPANNPRVEIYLTVDSPTKNNDIQFGSVQAEPYAKTILEETLHYLQVPIDPKDSRNGQPVVTAGKATPSQPQTFVQVPDFVGMSSDEAKAAASAASLTVDAVGNGTGPKVTGQWPDPSYGPVPTGSEVKLYYGPAGSQGGKVKMPDLRGMSMREAMETLSLLQLNMDPTGSGYVIEQAIPAGTLVSYGTSVKLNLAPQS